MAQNKEQVASAKRLVKIVVRELKGMPKRGNTLKSGLARQIETAVIALQLAELSDDLRSFVGTVMARCAEKGKRIPPVVQKLSEQFLTNEAAKPLTLAAPVVMQPQSGAKRIILPPPALPVPGMPGDSEEGLSSEEDQRVVELLGLVGNVLIARERGQRSLNLEPVRENIAQVFERPPAYISDDAWKTIADVLDLGLDIRQHVIKSDVRVVNGFFSSIPLELGRKYLFGTGGDKSIFGALVTEAQETAQRTNRTLALWFTPQAFMALNAFKAMWLKAENRWELSPKEKQLCDDFLGETNRLALSESLENLIRSFVGLYHGDSLGDQRRVNGSATKHA